jgi:hypothetical protein
VSARTTSDVELVVLAYAAGHAVPVDDDERNAAVRRALLVFAAGGNLHREPTLDDPAVLELAADLDAPERRAALTAAIRSADPSSELIANGDLAWRAYACALLAEALGEE